ncbi:hypothetical protein L3X38_032234 [Prunus dulcis]|uniref:Disease resistance R13L4/SHOC-2-like LRR domain-containing protein n=1 Tax=Prunus dulcis TaxID=3755 RepID=A0AAD4VFX9_PRUDU|nr:hypothetical protein L3X38_032234 [Prunus dulcis]
MDLLKTDIQALPIRISKLINLRHLVMCHSKSGSKLVGVKLPSSISKMKKLQSLGCIESEGNIIRLIGSMTQLKVLGITNVKERDEKDLCASIQEMKVLSYLYLSAAGGEEFLRVDALSSPSSYFDGLDLIGKLEKVPHWFCSLQCLTHLYLRGSSLEEDLLPHIEALPSLLSLCLNDLGIYRFLGLETLPQGIEHLTKLQGYTFECVSEKFAESIREGGVDHARMLLVDERCNKYTDKSSKILPGLWLE